MSKTELKKYIKDLEPDVLRQMLLDVYSISKEAKVFLDYAINPDDNKMLEMCKDVIDKEFRPTMCYRRLTFSKSKKAISNFKKLDPHPKMLAEAMIYMLESAVDTAAIWGNVEESFAITAANNYMATLRHIDKYGLLADYKSVMSRLARRIDMFGYGVGFQVYDFYDELYDEDP